MEVTLDIGKYIYTEISKISKIDNADFDVTASKLLELGVRIYLSSLKNNNDTSYDSNLMEILKEVVNNNHLLKEVLSHVFTKERSMLKTYDAVSATMVAENLAESYIKGKLNSIAL